MSIPYYPAPSAPQQHSTSLASSNQDHLNTGAGRATTTTTTSSSTGTGSNHHPATTSCGPISPTRSTPFFERHNIFGRSRSRSSFNSAAAASLPSLRSDSPEVNQAGYLSAEPTSPTSRRSAFRPGLLTRHSSSSTSQIHLDSARTNTSQTSNRIGFPSSRPSSGFRPTHEDHDQSANGQRMSGSNPMTRTGSSGASGSSNNPFGRMFRRYSQGQGGHVRTSSNASDAPPPFARTITPTHASSHNRGPGFNGAASGAAAALPSLDPVSASESLPAAITSAAPEGLLSGNFREAAANEHPVSAPATTTFMANNSSSIPSASAQPPSATNPSSQLGVHRIRLVPHLEATRSLHFEPIERDVREGATPVKIGRFTDRVPPPSSMDDPVAATGVTSTAPTGSAPGNRGGAVPSTAGGGGRIDSARIAFKSKVVSRGHAEIWCDGGGKFFIRDTKSSSGTFLNHIRLAGANIESRPFPIKDGDILQLGVDYQGGTEEIYRCVKIRVELNRGWQREANQFNVNALRQLRALQGSPISTNASKTAAVTSGGTDLPTNRQSMNVTDCCICLFSVTVCQALFIAPCSHVFHYKCIRPLLSSHYPGFSCPLCRTFADLEADVEEDEAWQEALLKEAEASQQHGLPTPMVEVPTATASGQANPSPFASSSVASQRDDHPITPLPASAPLTSSGLRQEVALGVSDTGQRGRPGTAVAPSPNTADHTTEEQYDGTVVFPERSERRRTARVSHENGASADEEDDVDEAGLDDGNEERDEDEEEEELLLDERAGFGAEVMHEIDRISEEVDRSSTSSVGGHTGSPQGLQARRGSQPIAIVGSLTDKNSDGILASGQLGASSGFSPLEEARTPVNQHVLSVLAEAPPPNTAAARRLAMQRQQQVIGAGNNIGKMLSLGGASSDLLQPSPPRVEPRSSDGGGSRRGSNVSDDADFATPAEGSQEGHTAIISNLSGHRIGSTGPRAFSPSLQAAAQDDQGRGQSTAASTSSNRASPSTAGEMDVDGEVDDVNQDDDHVMGEAGGGGGEAAVPSSRRGSTIGGSSKGKSRKRETSTNGSLDSTGSHSYPIASSINARTTTTTTPAASGQGGDGPGGPAKIRAILRRATGGGGGGGAA